MFPFEESVESIGVNTHQVCVDSSRWTSPTSADGGITEFSGEAVELEDEQDSLTPRIV